MVMNTRVAARSAGLGRPQRSYSSSMSGKHVCCLDNVPALCMLCSRPAVRACTSTLLIIRACLSCSPEKGWRLKLHWGGCGLGPPAIIGVSYLIRALPDWLSLLCVLACELVVHALCVCFLPCNVVGQSNMSVSHSSV
jgi:hypothetical protein